MAIRQRCLPSKLVVEVVEVVVEVVVMAVVKGRRPLVVSTATRNGTINNILDMFLSL